MYPLVVNEDGSIEHIVSGENAKLSFEEIGEVEVKRASHVVPFDPLKRMAFITLRRLFGDSGKISDWTRSWTGPWIVFVVEGGWVLGPFRTREKALEREVAWLLAQKFGERWGLPVPRKG